MTLHKEGFSLLLISFVGLAILIFLTYLFFPTNDILKIIVVGISVTFYLLLLQFFRSPKRNIVLNEKNIIAPANGKIVVIEETEETEFFKEKRLQVSIFMSPFDPHINRYPVGGKIIFQKYHPGLFLFAWNPKSSVENERTTVVIQMKNNVSILVRQIAGILARRIVCYSKSDDIAAQGAEFGFIKFGSRVDLFLPLDCKINVKLNQHVYGGESIIAEFQG